MRRKVIIEPFIAGVFCCALGLSCARPSERSVKPTPASKGEIAGQVFIVTKGGTNVRLGLVEVVAIPEALLMPFVEKKRSEQERDREAIRAAVADERAAEAESKIKQADVSAHNAARRRLYRAEENRKEKTAEWYAKRESRYFDGLPVPAARTKTDADGRFEFRLPTGRYGLVASGSREIGNVAERYYWMVWHPVTAGERAAVMLSNDNQVDSGSPESVLDLRISLYWSAAEGGIRPSPPTPP